MTPFQRRRNPYVNRMAQDMQIRNLAASTIDSYTWHVDKFCSHFGKRPKKLPVVLSDQEASRLIECTENPKHRTVLLTCYAAGLRVAEATHLKVADIDGPRAQIRITSGKGSKVTFLARSKDKSPGNPQVEHTIPGVEFVRRWSLHILSQRFHALPPLRRIPREREASSLGGLPLVAA